MQSSDKIKLPKLGNSDKSLVNPAGSNAELELLAPEGYFDDDESEGLHPGISQINYFLGTEEDLWNISKWYASISHEISRPSYWL